MVPLLARRTRVLVMVAAAATLTLSCIFPVIPALSPAKTGTLKIDINYTDTWYRETFGYTRDAPNIRHLVLVVPQDRQDDIIPNQVFTAIQGTVSGTALPPDQQWMLDYLYDAPEGYFTGDFEPGDYAVAVAFVAAPLSMEEAGVPEDTILYAGITGGGASTGFQPIVITPGETTALTVTLTDANGWACPWLYVFNGDTFERRTEILRNLDGKSSEHTEVTPLGFIRPVDGAITVRIAEEKDEITFIDSLFLVIDGVQVPADAEPDLTARLAARRRGLPDPDPR